MRSEYVTQSNDAVVQKSSIRKLPSNFITSLKSLYYWPGLPYVEEMTLLIYLFIYLYLSIYLSIHLLIHFNLII